MDVHFDFGAQPVAHNLMDTPVPAKRYPFKVAFCEDCGFQQLVDFIPPEVLYQNYFTLSGWKRQTHAVQIIDRARQLFDIELQTPILEVGCNDGSFLSLLRDRGYSNLVGIEPTKDASGVARSRHFKVYQGFFASEAIQKVGLKAGLIVTRQVLEHVPDLHAFMSAVNDSLVDGGGLIIEVPDHSMNYETLDYTFWEEHVNYFTLNTLRNLLARTGFEIVHHETVLFSGKALIVYAQRSRDVTADHRNLDRTAAYKFKNTFPQFRAAIHQWVALQPAGCVLYGAGARSTNFCNLLGISDRISAVIDDQPEKQQKYLPGFSVQIRQPKDYDVGDKLCLLGVGAENETLAVGQRGLKSFASILPPSRNLPAFWRRIGHANTRHLSAVRQSGTGSNLAHAGLPAG